MLKFLVDENLSPHLVEYLRGLNYEAIAVREVGLKGKPDAELIKWIQKEKILKNKRLSTSLLIASKDKYRLRKYISS